MLPSYLGQSSDIFRAPVFSWGHPVSISAELYHNEYIIDIIESFTGQAWELWESPGLTANIEQFISMMAFHNNYMVPMFSIPQVTWASQTAGQASMGKFPNPRSVMKISKFKFLNMKLWHCDTMT